MSSVLKVFKSKEIQEAKGVCVLCELATDVSFPPPATHLAVVVGYSPDGSASVNSHVVCSRCAEQPNVAIVGGIPVA